jgi:predicted deacylase
MYELVGFPCKVLAYQTQSFVEVMPVATPHERRVSPKHVSMNRLFPGRVEQSTTDYLMITSILIQDIERQALRF